MLVSNLFFTDSWKLSFQRSYLGKTYTLTNYTLPINKAVGINFQHKRIYIFLHDPDFFLGSRKDRVIPKCRFQLKPGEIIDVNIEAKYYELLDRPTQRCNNDEGYSFTKCVEVRL